MERLELKRLSGGQWIERAAQRRLITAHAQQEGASDAAAATWPPLQL
jgi:hypothetical protein